MQYASGRRRDAVLKLQGATWPALRVCGRQAG